MDRIIAFILIIIISPILGLLMFMTLLDLKCNPIFIQKRTVSGPGDFSFYKIRSMYKTAPNVPTGEFINIHMYSSRWGRFLRLYSLDELLNLICIVNGDMLFIGPRPIMICETELLLLRKKNGIVGKPGITGLAQISGRDLITVNRKIACERYYNRKSASLSLKLFIIYKTFVIVVNKTGITH